jgi:GIY-YIG catalytic domain.
MSTNTEQVELSSIDWDSNFYDITENASVDLSSDSPIDKQEIIRTVAKLFEKSTDSTHYVYCLSVDEGSRWYVGETANLYDRFCTHLRTRDVTNIEFVKPASDKEHSRERERELSYQVAIDKNTTEVYGGR